MYGFQSYINNSSLGYDLDIQGALESTLYGNENEPARGRWVVWQKCKRDKSGAPIKSPYTYKLTDEGSDNRGPATTRTGFLCDELLIRASVKTAGKLIFDELGTPLGQIPLERLVFYVAANVDVEEHDVFILPKINMDGELINPVQIDQELNVTLVITRALDDGRPEFKAVIAEMQK